MIFDDPAPRLYAMPPGADFPCRLVHGLRRRMVDRPPEAMARVRIFVNTPRMQRRICGEFVRIGASLLPRIQLVAALPDAVPVPNLPRPVSPLRRRLELSVLIARLLDRAPDLAPRSALYDLADSLAGLMEEMQAEGIAPDRIADLDVAQHSRHWARTRDFMAIAAPYFAAHGGPDAEARLRATVQAMIAGWAADPPQDPVIVAGSTGSRGTIAMLMQAVARLPQGAVVMPGFDFDLPAEVWSRLDDPMTGEDHAQYRFRNLIHALGLTPDRIELWDHKPPPAPGRNRLISLSLRPAPVTDQWLAEGQALPDLVEATGDATLIEAPDPRTEALAIALVLREAAEGTETAALVTADRTLARRVAAALDRWGILPDDAGGRPLSLTAPGRLLRHVAGLAGRRASTEAVLTLLKHPLTATGGDRAEHLRLTRRLEMALRRAGAPFPDGAVLSQWARRDGAETAEAWARWLAQALSQARATGTLSMADHAVRHVELAESIACGPWGEGTGGLYDREAGEAARAVTASLLDESVHGGRLTPADYRNLFDAILAREEVREPVLSHPRILIWGTQEARVQGADLVVLGGLNDGVWPRLPTPDPWLNRQMRRDAGLFVPDRCIGLAAHDYQQAVAAGRVVLTRSKRDAEAETVASRWLNRLQNLMGGLSDRRGPEALAAMRARGDRWLDLARALDAPGAALAAGLPPARRPSPRPPVAARPREMAVTGIERLLRDPYAVYAQTVLRLHPLPPLRPEPDPLLRGSVLHAIFERFVRDRPASETRMQARARLQAETTAVLARDIPWAATRILWQSRLNRVADFFLDFDLAYGGAPIVLERPGRIPLEGIVFVLKGRPDRIDQMPDGRLHIIDYKTGAPPSPEQQRYFDKQLALLAAMAERGAFPDIGPMPVGRTTYLGLGNTPKASTLALDEGEAAQVWAELHRLIGRYMTREQGYTARRAPRSERDETDYDHLARYGEWGSSDPASPEDVGPPEPAGGRP